MISPFHDASQEVRTFFYLIARFPFFFLPFFLSPSRVTIPLVSPRCDTFSCN